MTLPPTSRPLASSTATRTHLPKRDELVLRAVVALPSASSSGLACSSRAVSCPPSPPPPSAAPPPPPPPPPPAAATARLLRDDDDDDEARRERHTRYRIATLIDSVLPAPLSPETTTLCPPPPWRARPYARSTTAYTCGGMSSDGSAG